MTNPRRQVETSVGTGFEMLLSELRIGTDNRRVERWLFRGMYARNTNIQPHSMAACRVGWQTLVPGGREYRQLSTAEPSKRVASVTATDFRASWPRLTGGDFLEFTDSLNCRTPGFSARSSLPKWEYSGGD